MVEEVGKIYAKLAKIQQEVGAIEKNGRGPAQKGGFAYIKYEDVLDKVHALMVQEGVIVAPKLKYYNHEVREANNRQNLYARVEAEYTFIAVEDGSSVTVSSVGEGSDIGSDTATRKAATQVLKIALLHTFTIPNSDDGILLDNEGAEPAEKATAPTKAAPGAKTPTKKVQADPQALATAQNKVKELVAAHADQFPDKNAYVPIGNKLFADDKLWTNNADKVTKLHDHLAERVAKGEVIEA